MTTNTSTPYQSFAKILTSYHGQYAEAGPSSSQLDTPIRRDVVLNEEGGLITSLMTALEETFVSSPHLIDSQSVRMVVIPS